MILFLLALLVVVTGFFVCAEAIFERDWPKRTIKGFLIALLLLGMGARAFGQASRFDWIVSTTNNSAPQPGGLYPALYIPGSAIAVCTAPANAVPCTNYAPTYTDATHATACPLTPTPLQLTRPGSNVCVAGADAQGGWGVWMNSGNYQYTVTTTYGSFGPYDFSIGGSGGGGSPGSPTSAVQLNIAGSFGTIPGFSANTNASLPNFNGINIPNLINLLPRVDVRSPQFSQGSPIKNLVLSGNTGCTSGATITATISAPVFSPGVQAIANLGCGTNGKIYLNPMNNEGAGYDNTVTIAISGTGVSGATATPILDTPGAADPSGVACSSAAIQSAISFSIAQGSLATTSSQMYPVVYVPGAPDGGYLLCKTLDVPSGIFITGDDRASTNLQTNGDFPAFYVYLPTVGYGGPTAGSDVGLGAPRNFTITGKGTGSTTPLMIVRQGRGLLLDNLHFAQTGGIGLEMAAGERDMISNVFFNNVRWCEDDNGQNETHHFNVNCANPGQVQNVGSSTAYCYEVNCINGIGIAGWGGGTLTAAGTDGAGGAYFTVNKALSPIVTGQTFQVAGITDLTALNGTWTATNAGAPFSQVTGFSITSNVATINAQNVFVTGESVTFANMTVGTYFNGVTFTVTSASSSQFTVAITHANVAFTADTGQTSAVGLNNCSVPTSPYTATSTCATTTAGSFVVIASLTSGTYIQGPDFGNAILCATITPCTAPTPATPSAGTSSGLGSATWKPSAFPHYNRAIMDYGGSMNWWQRSSVKSIVHAAAFQSNDLSPTVLSGFYIEDAVPGTAGPGIIDGAAFPYTYTTTDISPTTCTFTPSSTADCVVGVQSISNMHGQGWYPYQMDMANAGQEIVVACADYNPASSALCANGNGAQQNQVEVMVIYFTKYSGSNLGYIGARNFFGTSAGLPTNVTWPAGSLMGMINFKGTSGGGFLQLFKNHINANVSSDSPTGVYATNSADASFYPSASILVGGVPDGVANLLPGTTGQSTFNPAVQLSDSSTDSANCTAATEAFGFGCIKVLGGGSVYLYGNSNPVVASPENAVDIANCASYSGQSQPVIFVQYAGGVNSAGTMVDSDTNTLMFHSVMAATPCIFTQRLVRGELNATTVFSRAYQFFDAPATAGATSPVQYSFNGALSGNNGFQIQTNNGSTTTTAFMVNVNPSTGTGSLTGYALSNIPVRGSFTTTAVTADTVPLSGCTALSHVWVEATNTTAAALTGVFVTGKTTNQFTLNHSATAGGTFDIFCTSN